MGENLKNYMTHEEQRQVDSILKRAEERMRKKQYFGSEHQFLFFGCQCGCYEKMERQNQEHQEKIDFGRDVQKLLRQLCGFCRQQGACLWEGGMEGEGELDEDLPF